MRPYPEELLRAIQAGIGAHFAPEVQSTYGKAQMAYAGLLFMIAQRDYDSAVPDLIESNRTLRTLLQQAGDALRSVDGDATASARAALDALPPPADSLRLSALRAEHDALRAAVCALAPAIEPTADDQALAALRPSRTALFAWLEADARRRSVPILSA